MYRKGSLENETPKPMPNNNRGIQKEGGRKEIKNM